jgi:hypothetical protein
MFGSYEKGWVVMYCHGNETCILPHDPIISESEDYRLALGHPEGVQVNIQKKEVSAEEFKNIRWMRQQLEEPNLFKPSSREHNQLGRLCKTVGYYLPSQQRMIFHWIIYYLMEGWEMEQYLHPRRTLMDKNDVERITRDMPGLDINGLYVVMQSEPTTKEEHWFRCKNPRSFRLYEMFEFYKKYDPNKALLWEFWQLENHQLNSYGTLKDSIIESLIEKERVDSLSFLFSIRANRFYIKHKHRKADDLLYKAVKTENLDIVRLLWSAGVQYDKSAYKYALENIRDQPELSRLIKPPSLSHNMLQSNKRKFKELREQISLLTKRIKVLEGD